MEYEYVSLQASWIRNTLQAKKKPFSGVFNLLDCICMFRTCLIVLMLHVLTTIGASLLLYSWREPVLRLRYRVA